MSNTLLMVGVTTKMISWMSSSADTCFSLFRAERRIEFCIAEASLTASHRRSNPFSWANLSYCHQDAKMAVALVFAACWFCLKT